MIVRILAMVVLCCAHLGAQEPRPIAGRVLGADGAPAAGAEVFLRWRAHPELPGVIGHSLDAVVGAAGPGQGELIRVTDDKGRFRFRPPHRGPFLLVAHGAGLATSSARAFPVMPGSFHPLRLEPSFFMGGRVVDAKGGPVAGAAVRVVPTELQWERVGIYGEPERRPVARTDAAGRFRLLYEHGYLRAPRWHVLMAPLAVANGCSSGQVLEPLRPVRSTRELSLTLSETPAMFGRVVDTRGMPVVGAEVFDPALSGVRVLTDGAGRYTVPACAGQLWIRADGYAPVAIVGQHGAQNDAMVLEGVRLRARLVGPTGPLAGARVLWVLPVSGQAPLEWTATTDASGRVEGRGFPRARLALGFVEIEGRFRRFLEIVPAADRDLGDVRVRKGTIVRGQVLSHARQPLAGVRVTLRPRAVNALFPPYVTYTDHGGRFEFDPVSGEHIAAVDAGSHGTTSRPAGKQPLVLQLPGGPGVTGRVLDPEGRPAPGAWVTISRSLTPDGTFAPAPRLEMQALCTLTDDEGRFSFTGLPAGASWSIVGALMREQVKYNVRGAVQTGGNVELKVALEQR